MNAFHEASRICESVKRVSSRLCVERMTVHRQMVRSLLSRVMTFSAFSGSRLPVGSSARTSDGRSESARAKATRCCCPPDSCRGCRMTQSWILHSSTSCLHHCTVCSNVLISCSVAIVSVGVALVCPEGETP